ncbi:MAG TPA: hypothetical protein VGQ36_00685 [Thermoanaerobaculia bacterium]|jgi:hypothetical protein|nr:hypothetical protein [Thermoanaerobaculia bacterium]
MSNQDVSKSMFMRMFVAIASAGVLAGSGIAWDTMGPRDLRSQEIRAVTHNGFRAEVTRCVRQTDSIDCHLSFTNNSSKRRETFCLLTAGDSRAVDDLGNIYRSTDVALGAGDPSTNFVRGVRVPHRASIEGRVRFPKMSANASLFLMLRVKAKFSGDEYEFSFRGIKFVDQHTMGVRAEQLSVRNVRIGTARSAVLADLGPPAKTRRGHDDVMGMGQWEELHYPGLLVLVILPEEGVLEKRPMKPYVASITISTGNWSTPAGLQVGSSLADVRQALGSPVADEPDEQGRQRYRYETARFDGRVVFTFVDDRVVEISIEEDWT